MRSAPLPLPSMQRFPATLKTFTTPSYTSLVSSIASLEATSKDSSFKDQTDSLFGYVNLMCSFKKKNIFFGGKLNADLWQSFYVLILVNILSSNYKIKRCRNCQFSCNTDDVKFHGQNSLGGKQHISIGVQAEKFMGDRT